MLRFSSFFFACGRFGRISRGLRVLSLDVRTVQEGCARQCYVVQSTLAVTVLDCTPNDTEGRKNVLKRNRVYWTPNRGLHRGLRGKRPSEYATDSHVGWAQKFVIFASRMKYLVRCARPPAIFFVFFFFVVFSSSNALFYINMF